MAQKFGYVLIGFSPFRSGSRGTVDGVNDDNDDDNNNNNKAYFDFFWMLTTPLI